MWQEDGCILLEQYFFHADCTCASHIRVFLQTYHSIFQSYQWFYLDIFTNIFYHQRIMISNIKILTDTILRYAYKFNKIVLDTHFYQKYLFAKQYRNIINNFHVRILRNFLKL